jgi:hypothetical protein
VKTIIMIGVAVVALTACGGSGGGEPERVLHMRGYDIPESAFAFYVQDSLIGTIDGFCDKLQEPSIQSLINKIIEGTDTGGVVGPADIIEGGTPVPGQAVAPEVPVAVAEIIKQECGQ